MKKTETVANLSTKVCRMTGDGGISVLSCALQQSANNSMTYLYLLKQNKCCKIS